MVCNCLLQVEQNRDLLRPQIEILKLCAVQNISLRGHRDDGELGSDVIQPENDGNYRHLLRFRMASGDESLKMAISHAGANCKYISKTIQNELLNVMASMVKENITVRVKRAHIWSILADETTDLSCREQMVLVARYVDFVNDAYVVCKDPFCVGDVFAEIEGMKSSEEDDGHTEVKLSGANLGQFILTKIGKANLDTAACVGQGYDKASAMASGAAGAAAFVQKTAQLADYFRCVSHATNLSCSKCTHIPVIRNAQDVMAQTINNFSASAKRAHLLKKHADLQADCDSGKLIGLCTTRFVERHAAVARFWNALPAVVSALQEQELWSDRDASIKAHTLLSCLEKSDTLVGLGCLNAVSGIMKPLSQALQKKGGDLVRALDLVDDTTRVLNKMRSDDTATHSFSSVFSETLTLAQRIGITLQKPRIPVGKSMHRAAAAAEGSVEEYYRINVFNAGIDSVLTDFKARFGEHVRLSAGLNCLLPNLVHDKSWADVKEAYTKYSRHLPGAAREVEAEFAIWKQHWENITEKTSTMKVCRQLYSPVSGTKLQT